MAVVRVGNGELLRGRGFAGGRTVISGPSSSKLEKLCSAASWWSSSAAERRLVRPRWLSGGYMLLSFPAAFGAEDVFVRAGVDGAEP